MRQMFGDPFDKTTNEYSEFQQKCLGLLSKSKGAPLESLTSRISITLTKCLNMTNGVQLICTLWLEFVDRLSSRWDDTENIEGYVLINATLYSTLPHFRLEIDATPDLTSCLLHQKLQMLQFCIETKRKRHDFMSKNPNKAMTCSTCKHF